MKYKLLFLFTLIIFVACKEESYNLKWEIGYRTNIIFDLSMHEVEESKRSLKDSSIETSERILQSSGYDSSAYCLIIKETNYDELDVKVVKYLLSIDRDLKGLDGLGMLQQQGVKTHAKIDHFGNIKNRYKLKYLQKNFIALLTQLPSLPVKVGDKWSLNISYNDKLFKDVEEKVQRTNFVEFIEVREEGENEIAILKYNIELIAESVWTSVFLKKPVDLVSYFKFNGKCEFDINKGEWRNFNGILITKEKGFVDEQEVKLVNLTRLDEIPEKALKIIQEEATDDEWIYEPLED